MSEIRAKAREAAHRATNDYGKSRKEDDPRFHHEAIADAVTVAVLREVLNYPHKCYTAAYAAVPVPDLERELDALLREADPAIDPAKLASSREADPPAVAGSLAGCNCRLVRRNGRKVVERSLTCPIHGGPVAGWFPDPPALTQPGDAERIAMLRHFAREADPPAGETPLPWNVLCHQCGAKALFGANYCMKHIPPPPASPTLSEPERPIRAKAREELRRLRTLCESTWRSHRDPRDYAYNECEGDDECLWCAETRDAIEKLDALLREADPPAGETREQLIDEAMKYHGIPPTPEQIQRVAEDFVKAGEIEYSAASPTLSEPEPGLELEIRLERLMHWQRGAQAAATGQPCESWESDAFKEGWRWFHNNETAMIMAQRIGAVADKAARAERELAELKHAASPTLSEPGYAFPETHPHEVTFIDVAAPVSPAAQP